MGDILQFYAFSADKNAGSGVGDVVKDISIYEELNKITNWRRMFSSKWSGNPFKYENLTYYTFDHAYQAQKYKINGYDEAAYLFSIESKSELCKANRIGRPKVLSKVEIEKWENEKRQIKDKIYRAKFTHTTWPGRVLMLTRNAILINDGPRIKRRECTRLMEVRKELLN